MENGREHLRETLQREWAFFAVLVLFWIFSAWLWAAKGYDEGFVWMNGVRYEPLSWASLHFFTHLGDGIILPALVILIFWRRDPAFVITFLVAVVATAFVTQFGKRILFEDWMRPSAVFEGVSGVEIYDPHPPRAHSFPSGHATSSTTGGVFFAYALAERRRWLSWLVGLFTVFLCVTRVIVGAHFPGDIFIGSIIGSVGALLVLVVAYPIVRRRIVGWQGRSNATLGYAVMGFAILLILGQFAHLLLL